MASQSEYSEEVNSYFGVRILVYLSLKARLLSWSQLIKDLVATICRELAVCQALGQVLCGLSPLILRSPKGPTIIPLCRG